MGFAANGTYTPPSGSENAFSGQVIASATWNAIFVDIAAALTALSQSSAPSQTGLLNFYSRGINFNPGVATDTAISLTLPSGVTRYQVNSVIISGASHSLSTATIGVFTATGGGGVTIAADQAITVTATADATVNNSQSLNLTNQTTTTFTTTTLQIRIGTSEGVAATGNVVVRITPVS